MRREASSETRLYDALAVAPSVSAGGRRSVDLDALRAVAALLVVANHTSIWGGPPFPRITDQSLTTLLFSGGGGLSLFFALSGFLIAGPFLRSLVSGAKLPNMQHYAVRRAARILPAYWIALAGVVLLVHQPHSLAWWQLPVHIGLVQNFVPGEAAAIFVVAWTLSLEAQFYVFVPLAAVFVRRMRRRAVDIDLLARGILVLWAAVLLWGVFVAAVHPGTGAKVDSLRASLPGLLSGFLPGMLVFLAETEQAKDRGGAWGVYRRLARRPAVLLTVTGVVWCVGTFAQSSTSSVVADLGKHFLAIASGLALAAVLQAPRWLRQPARVLAPIGLVSYGVYLWHWIVINAAVRYGLVPLEGHGPLRYGFHFAVILCATLMVATVSWVFVERPILRATERVRNRRIPVRPALP